MFDGWYEEPMLISAMLFSMAGLNLLPLLVLWLSQGLEARDCLWTWVNTMMGSGKGTTG